MQFIKRYFFRDAWPGLYSMSKTESSVFSSRLVKYHSLVAACTDPIHKFERSLLMLRHDSDMTRSNAGILGKEKHAILCPPGTSKNIGFRTINCRQLDVFSGFGGAKVGTFRSFFASIGKTQVKMSVSGWCGFNVCCCSFILKIGAFMIQFDKHSFQMGW